MTTYNKLLSCALLGSLLATGCYALSLSEVHGSLTISFGKQPKNQYLAMLETALPVNASELRSGK